jgi:tripartite-type tricarboxylate transporter receptor subunit TctC
MDRRTLLKTLAAAGAQVLPALAQAQDFPSRSVRLVVPYAAGGSTDQLARGVAESLSKNWQQPVVVDNRPGGGGMTGTQAVVGARPDGYTVLLVGVTPLVMAPFVTPELKFDLGRDLTPVTQVATTALVFVAGKNRRTPRTAPSAWARPATSWWKRSTSRRNWA